MVKKYGVGRVCFFYICTLIVTVVTSGCGHFDGRSEITSAFQEANDFFSQGNYSTSLRSYQEIAGKHPTAGDRALFETGVVYAYPKNEQKDYQKAVESFQKLIQRYPESGYRQDSEMMIFYLTNVAMKDQVITTQQTRVEALQQELSGRDNEIAALTKKIEALERKVFALALAKGSVDKILVEKKERRLMLITNGEVVKTYKIALGGNPNGPKERQGDNKTPEGTYFIDSRNRDSRYHLALHISYPNEKDRKRARELGVSPGGDIMIHGIKKGLSWVGGSHAGVDWTKGCIAVTDEEIEEIDKLAPNGTVVEIRP